MGTSLTSVCEVVRHEVVTMWSLLVPSHAVKSALCLRPGTIVLGKSHDGSVAHDVWGSDL